MKRDFFHTGLQVSRSQMKQLTNIMGPGNMWYVDYEKGNDSNGGEAWSEAFKTYGQAIDACTTNTTTILFLLMGIQRL